MRENDLLQLSYLHEQHLLGFCKKRFENQRALRFIFKNGL